MISFRIPYNGKVNGRVLSVIQRRHAMRCIIFSSTALIVVGAVAATPSFAAAKREAMHVANLSVTDSFNACVGLAKQAGL